MGQKQSTALGNQRVDKFRTPKSSKKGHPVPASSPVVRKVQSSAMKLLWAARLSAMHKVLSFNILREIRAYLSDQTQQLIAVLQEEVKSFDLPTSQWHPLCSNVKNVVIGSHSAAVFIGDNKVFVCGIKIGRPISYILQKGEVAFQPYMNTPRLFFGMIYDLSAQAVYVFGGKRNDNLSSALSTCEKFLMSSSQWEEMPDMHRERSSFNPCWFSSLVYLCGGRLTDSVEQYDPKVNAFFLLTIVLPEAGDSITIVDSDCLVVITKTCICRMKQEITATKSHPKYYLVSTCTPVAREGVGYIVYLDTCYGINLETGGIVMKENSCDLH